MPNKPNKVKLPFDAILNYIFRKLSCLYKVLLLATVNMDQSITSYLADNQSKKFCQYYLSQLGYLLVFTLFLF